MIYASTYEFTPHWFSYKIEEFTVQTIGVNRIRRAGCIPTTNNFVSGFILLPRPAMHLTFEASVSYETEIKCRSVWLNFPMKHFRRYQ